MRSVYITLIAAICGWLGGILTFILMGLFQDHAVLSISQALRQTLAIALCIAIAITPICLFIVLPLVHYVPITSSFWRSYSVIPLFAVLGLIGIYLWVAFAGYGHFFVPPWSQAGTWWFGIPACIVGATTGFVTSRHIQKEAEPCVPANPLQH